MKELCVFCGEPLESCQHSFRKMCVNCSFCTIKQNEDGVDYVCSNEKNLQMAKDKMFEAAKSAVTSYSITHFNVDIEALPLKKPNGKCGEWSVNEELLLTEIKKQLK